MGPQFLFWPEPSKGGFAVQWNGFDKNKKIFGLKYFNQIHCEAFCTVKMTEKGPTGEGRTYTIKEFKNRDGKTTALIESDGY